MNLQSTLPEPGHFIRICVINQLRKYKHHLNFKSAYFSNRKLSPVKHDSQAEQTHTLWERVWESVIYNWRVIVFLLRWRFLLFLEAYCFLWMKIPAFFFFFQSPSNCTENEVHCSILFWDARFHGVQTSSSVLRCVYAAMKFDVWLLHDTHITYTDTHSCIAQDEVIYPIGIPSQSLRVDNPLKGGREL